MPTYSYKAQDSAGKAVKGELQAADEGALQRALHDQSLLLLSASEKDGFAKSSKRLKDNQISDYCRQIGTLVGSGISLVRALSIVTEQETLKPYEAITYANVLRSVRKGIPLSDAMDEQSGAFPDLLINMIRSSEAAGNLDKVATRMAVHYDKQYKLAKKISSGMTYPKILAFLIVVVVSVIMGYVMPQFEEMFSQMETLPLPTTILVAISDFVVGYWWVIILAVLVGIVIWRFLIAIPRVRYQVDKLKLKIPVFGPLEKIIVTARFGRSLASLYSSGIPIVTCLTIASRTIENAYIETQFEQAIAEVRQGENLSDALAKIDGFVKKLEFSIRVGEETGQLDNMLDTVADALEFESEIAINQMVSYIEPAMIVIMAVIVGFVMISVLLPIYGSYEVIGAEA